MEGHLEAWVVETFVSGVRLRASTWLCRADRKTVEEVVSIERISRFGSEPDTRLREARQDEIAELEASGTVIVFDPTCRDWCVNLTLPDGTSNPRIYRDCSLPDFLVAARKQADGISTTSLRPASLREIQEDDRERAEWQREAQREVLTNAKRQKWGERIGVIVQIVATPIFALWGLSTMAEHEVFGFVLVAIAGLSVLNISWWLLKFVLYHLSFAIGRGFRDGKGQ